MLRLAPRFRLTWPLLLLVSGLGCIVLALFEAERSVRSNQVIVDRALGGYASFAAWSYEEHFSEALRVAAQEVLGSVNMFHSNPPIPSAGGPAHSIPWNARCNCHHPKFGPLPVAFLGLTLGADTVEVAHNRAPAGMQGWLVDQPMPMMTPPVTSPPMTAERRRWIVDQLTHLARAPLSRWGYQVLIASDGDSTMVFALTNMPTAWGDTVVYGVQYSGRAIDSMLAAEFDERDLLPGALAVKGSNRDILAVEVRDASGHVLFTSGAPERWTLDAVATLPSSYGGLTIRMQIQPELAPRIIIGGLPRSRLPLLLALLVLAAGLTVTAVVQLRREATFARERSAFVASTSHELRTPLAQIRLVVDMLRLGREKDPARREASLALVDREVTRLQHLVDNVLRFSRGEESLAGGTEPVDVAAEARSVVTEFLPLARPRAANIQVVTNGTPVVLLQAGALRQVLLNLLDNAVKYGPAGQTITVVVESVGTSGARLTVRDTGPGIAGAERERIWEPFERGAAASARAAGGSGIGLTVVREIAQRHGGKASVESAGDGAAFVVEFPGSVS